MGPVPQPEEERDHPNHHDGNDIEDAEHPEVVINLDVSDTDSDSDGDEDNDEIHGGYIGYQALSQDVAGQQDSDSDDENESEGAEQNVDIQNTLNSAQGAGGYSVPEGLIHQVRHPDYPHTNNLPGYMQVPDMPKPDRKEMLWNQQHRQTDIPLEIDHADKIKSAMTNIQLPSSNVPDWARNLSEEQWQAQIVTKLVNKKSSAKNNTDVCQLTSESAHVNSDKTEKSGLKE